MRGIRERFEGGEKDFLALGDPEGLREEKPERKVEFQERKP